MSELVFMSNNEQVSIRWEKVVGWLAVFLNQTKMMPHKDPKLAAKGESMPSGETRIVERRLLLLDGLPKPFELDETLTAEFKKFIEEKVKPEIWKADRPGEPEASLLGPGGGAA